MPGLTSILSLFRNEFNKFNNTRAQMLYFIYHMIFRLILNLMSAIKNNYVRDVYVVMDVISYM